jgi:hypothetical protein
MSVKVSNGLDLQNQQINNVENGTNPQDAVTLSQVEALISGNISGGSAASAYLNPSQLIYGGNAGTP